MILITLQIVVTINCLVYKMTNIGKNKISEIPRTQIDLFKLLEKLEND